MVLPTLSESGISETWGSGGFCEEQLHLPPPPLFMSSSHASQIVLPSHTLTGCILCRFDNALRTELFRTTSENCSKSWLRPASLGGTIVASLKRLWQARFSSTRLVRINRCGCEEQPLLPCLDVRNTCYSQEKNRVRSACWPRRKVELLLWVVISGAFPWLFERKPGNQRPVFPVFSIRLSPFFCSARSFVGADCEAFQRQPAGKQGV